MTGNLDAVDELLLLEDPADVILDGRQAQLEIGRDLLVAEPLGDRDTLDRQLEGSRVEARKVEQIEHEVYLAVTLRRNRLEVFAALYLVEPTTLHP